MLDDTGLRVMELGGKGYCCSQMMVIMALDEMGREDPDLVRAAGGLCNGLGDCSGPCGVLTGSVLALGLYAAKGTDDEEPNDSLPLMLESLRDWFVARTLEYGGTACGDILDGGCGAPHPERCGGLVADANAKVREILVENGLDPAQGRDLS
ncbi:DVU_1555 family C-GCAxxG-C-C protein [Pseudodesulfovibrio indicus]|uniref:DVU_1555 family C-GCAxxG-C-C protein n=1 Tax=Pseudodesulfovibrio indicus TaxID=1716143 RepID=UPI00292D31D5|nr:DV_1555 family C-GCAxxG-C-C protein [Pseudodesulfovibrio indicus]